MPNLDDVNFDPSIRSLFADPLPKKESNDVATKANLTTQSAPDIIEILDFTGSKWSVWQ